MCICMSKSFHEKINLSLFVQYGSEHVMCCCVCFFVVVIFGVCFCVFSSFVYMFDSCFKSTYKG